MNNKEKAREFCSEVKKLSEKYNLPVFMVTEGASVTNNDGCEAVKNARDNHIKWEEENGFDPTEDWGNNKPNITFGLGEENKAYEKYFIGKSYLNPLTDPNKTNIFLANVTFEPKCRNNWHIHHATKGGGQILVCVDGEGWYQEEGKEAVSLKPGMVITIPAEVKHWHGAKKDSWFGHIAIEVPGENTSNEWCEEVSDEEYNKLGE